VKIAIFHATTFGGALRASHEQARRLAARGHELHIFTYRFNPEVCDLYHVSASVPKDMDSHSLGQLHELPDPRPRHRLVRWQKLPWRIQRAVTLLAQISDLRAFRGSAAETARLIDETQCDVVLAIKCTFTNAPLLLLELKAPACWYCHEPSRNLFEDAGCIADAGKDFLERTYRRRRRQAELAAARAADRILCNSSFSKEFIRRAYGLEAVPCRLGVDAEKFSPDPGVPRKNQVICWGPLWPGKGLDFIVRSVGLIPQSQRPKVVFPWTRGSAALEQELRSLASRCAVSLELPQGMDDTALLTRIRESRACVYAPEMEPLGLVPLEAMAAGLPVIGVREGGVRETVIDGVTGFLCERDEKSFADRLAQVLADDALCERMSQAAVANVRKEWTWDLAANALEAHLLQVAQRASGGYGW
jgi:glycosyltransferase involved in cell wall biosynthesis